MLKKFTLINFILFYIITGIFWSNYAKAINIGEKCDIVESNNRVDSIKQNVKELEEMANLGKKSITSREEYLNNLYRLFKDRNHFRKIPFVFFEKTRKTILAIEKRINNTFDFNTEYYEQLYNNTEKINCSIDCIEKTLNDLRKEMDEKGKQVEFNNNLSSIKNTYDELENKKIPEAQEELDNITKNIELKKQEKLELDNEVFNSISQLNETKYFYNKLVSNIADKNTTYNEIINNINDKNKTYNELANNITRTNETYNTILNENIPEIQNKLLNITKDYETKVEQMDNLKNISDKLNFEINKNKEELDNITKNIELKKQEKLELDNEVFNSISQLNETKYSYNKLVSNIADKNTTYNEIINNINDKNTTYNELTNNIARTNETYNTILNNNIPEAQKELDNIVKNIELKKREELELANKIVNLKSNLSGTNITYIDLTNEKISKIQQLLDNATRSYNYKLEQLSSLDKQIKDKNKVLNEMKDKYNSDETLEIEKLNKIKKHIEDKKEEKEKIDNEYEIIKKEVEKLKEKKIELQDEINNNEIKNNILKKDIVENEKKLSDAPIIDSYQGDNISNNIVDKNLKKRGNNEVKQQNYDPNEINKNNERNSIFDDVVNGANKILYTLNKNLNLSLFNEIDSDNLLSNNKDINNFKFSLNTEKVNRINSLNFKSDIVRFTVKKNVKFYNFNDFGFVLSYNDIYAKANKYTFNNEVVNSSLDSKSISTGIYFKYFIVENKKRNLFNNVKLIYTFSKNKQNYFINNDVNNYNFGKFESNQIALQTGLGTDLLLNNFFRLSPKIDLNAIFLKVGKRNLNIENIEQKFGTKSYNFISLTPAIFFTTSQFYIKNNAKIDFGTNLFYNIALSKTKIIVDNKERNMDKNIFGIGMAVNLLMFNNVNFGLNYNLFKTKSTSVDNGFGVSLSCNF